MIESQDIPNSQSNEDSIKIKELNSLVDSLSTNLAQSFYQTVKLLESIVSTHERYYEGSHSRFVSEKSEEVAQYLGFSETKTMEIKIAALLHDIGKIGFRDILLQKFPFEMNESELVAYKNHPEVGSIILSGYHNFEKISKIVLQHHERIDGSGFPHRLMKNEILPGAMIINVVDTYHNAMFHQKRDRTTTSTSSIMISNTSSYLSSTKNKFSSVMNYIHQKRNILFDSDIVDAFIDIIQRERLKLGQQVVMRLPIGKLEQGMIIAEDYYTSYGMLIAGKGERISIDSIKALFRFAENDEVPPKILVIR